MTIQIEHKEHALQLGKSHVLSWNTMQPVARQRVTNEEPLSVIEMPRDVLFLRHNNQKS